MGSSGRTEETEQLLVNVEATARVLNRPVPFLQSDRRRPFSSETLSAPIPLGRSYVWSIWSAQSFSILSSRRRAISSIFCEEEGGSATPHPPPLLYTTGRGRPRVSTWKASQIVPHFGGRTSTRRPGMRSERTTAHGATSEGRR